MSNPQVDLDTTLSALADPTRRQIVATLAQGPSIGNINGVLKLSPDRLQANGMGVAQRMAALVSRVLNGADPGDIPIKRPKEFELVLDLKSAQTPGLWVPHDILLRADWVIE